MVSQARLVGPDRARHRQGDDREIGRPEIVLPGFVGHRQATGILVEEVFAIADLFVRLPLHEGLEEEIDGLGRIAVLVGLPDVFEAREDHRRDEPQEDDRPSRPKAAAGLQEVGREEDNR